MIRGLNWLRFFLWFWGYLLLCSVVIQD